ncbi:MAG: hypothetical protein FVQ80_12305, partial [Planctomycetes bacterium]|nr:hypothetical protein [Planctomycetota bacterium]
MKKLTLILMILTFAGATQAATIPLTNPGFETGDYTGWSTWNWGGAPVPTINSVDVYAGSYSAQANRSAGGGSGAYQWVDINDVNTGDLLQLEGYGMTKGSNNNCTLVLAWFDIVGGTEQGRNEYHIGPQASWTYGKAIGVIPGSGIGAIKVEFANNGGAVAGPAYFDDLSVSTLPATCIPADPCNLLLNESFECASDIDADGNSTPDFWYTWAAEAATHPEDTEEKQVIDGNALDGLAYWSLSEVNDVNLNNGITGLQDVAGTPEGHAYQIVVYLRNPGATEMTCDVGLEFYDNFRGFMGADTREVTVPADNTWYKYDHAAAKMFGSLAIGARVTAYNGTIHVD